MIDSPSPRAGGRPGVMVSQPQPRRLPPSRTVTVTVTVLFQVDCTTSSTWYILGQGPEDSESARKIIILKHKLLTETYFQFDGAIVLRG
jgi:hypothetical protein